MKIVVDAMGGDQGPVEICAAALMYLQQRSDVELTLVGPEHELRQLIDSLNMPTPSDSRLRISHASEIISPEDEAVRAIRRKKDASMVRALEMVHTKEAAVAISPGNTGALLAGGILICGRTAGVDRPALASEFPTVDGRGFLMLDLGAGVDLNPTHLLDYAIMGVSFAQRVRQVHHPRVGLLNIGTEPKKGDALRRNAFPLLQEWSESQPDVTSFTNVEARDLLQCPVDVVVTDGFTGNMVLKTFEGALSTLQDVMRQALKSSPISQIGGLMVQGSLRRAFKRYGYAHYGGAILLGIQAPVIKCHGNAGREAMVSAFETGYRMAETGVVDLIESSFQEGRNQQ